MAIWEARKIHLISRSTTVLYPQNGSPALLTVIKRKIPQSYARKRQKTPPTMYLIQTVRPKRTGRKVDCSGLIYFTNIENRLPSYNTSRLQFPAHSLPSFTAPSPLTPTHSPHSLQKTTTKHSKQRQKSSHRKGTKQSSMRKRDPGAGKKSQRHPHFRC